MTIEKGKKGMLRCQREDAEAKGGRFQGGGLYFLPMLLDGSKCTTRIGKLTPFRKF